MDEIRKLPDEIVKDVAQPRIVESSEKKTLSEEEIRERVDRLVAQTRVAFRLCGDEEIEEWRAKGINVGSRMKDIAKSIEKYKAEGVPQKIITEHVTQFQRLKWLWKLLLNLHKNMVSVRRLKNSKMMSLPRLTRKIHPKLMRRVLQDLPQQYHLCRCKPFQLSSRN
jgi:hypothetical protein